MQTPQTVLAAGEWYGSCGLASAVEDVPKTGCENARTNATPRFPSLYATWAVVSPDRGRTIYRNVKERSPMSMPKDSDQETRPMDFEGHKRCYLMN